MPDLLRPAGPPAPVPDVDPPRAQDPRFSEVVPHAARLVALYDQAVFCEGPTWWPARGILVWSDIEGRRVLGWHPDGRVEVVIDATPFINGNTVDRDGNLVHCEHGNRRLSRTWPDGRYEVLVDSYRGDRFNSPNDVVCAADGALWFSDPAYGLMMPKQGRLAPSETRPSQRLPLRSGERRSGSRGRASASRTASPSRRTGARSTSPTRRARRGRRTHDLRLPGG
ncbi:SMP-30/gluconolactonase/LRE family protein [Methylobacterium sp. P31]